MIIVRRIDAQAQALQALGWAVALGLPAMAAGFFVGLLRWRLFVANALQSLGPADPCRRRTPRRCARTSPRRSTIPSCGSSTGCPGAGRWADADGSGRASGGRAPASARRRSRTATARSRRSSTTTRCRDQDELVEAAAGYARVALDNRRLYAEVEASLEEVRESRARIVASADAERRRIERDLHDGAQQRLVALRIKLELAEEALRDDPDAGAERLHALAPEVEATLDEIRSLAHGVYPPLLADRGLAEALRAAALHAPLTATVSSDGIGRYPPEVESAVYFCCLEALQNAAKHADGATRRDHLAVGGRQAALRGPRRRRRPRGRQLAPGAGLTNMRDRVTALGGDLEVASAAGAGAVVTGSIPVPS